MLYEINHNMLKQAGYIGRLMLTGFLWSERSVHGCKESLHEAVDHGGFFATAAATFVFLAALTLSEPARAERSLPTPGSTWGEIRYPGSAQPEDSENLILAASIHELVARTLGNRITYMNRRLFLELK